MPYGRKARTVRAYRFGALPPREGWEQTLEQHRLRTRYWNALVELERERRQRRDEIVNAAIARASDDEQSSRDARRAAFRDPAVQEQLHALDRELYERQKEIRHQLVAEGLYWPNYMDVERYFDTARKRPDPPRFHRFDPREGRVAYPFTHGLPLDRLLSGTDTRARLVTDPARKPRGGRRAGLWRCLLFLRVGTEDREPVWLVLPLTVHRPLPPGGIVREIGVNWRRIGTGVEWSVSIVVETAPAETEPALDPSGSRAVAVDLSWRMVQLDQVPSCVERHLVGKGGEGPALRAGYWIGEDGAMGEILLSPSWLAAYERVQGLRSLRDTHLNALRAALVAWIDAAPGVPEWLAEARKTMPQWRAQARFAALALRWRDLRFDGDNASYALIEEWRKLDKHLYEWEAHLRTKLLAERRHAYRVLAAALSRRYERLVLEAFDLRRVAADPGRRDLPEQARAQRVIAAVSELRTALVNAFERDHGKGSVIVVPAEHTTVACHVCGVIEEGWDPATDLWHVCAHCGAAWDQDANACRNLIQRANLERAATA